MTGSSRGDEAQKNKGKWVSPGLDGNRAGDDRVAKLKIQSEEQNEFSLE